MNIDVASLVAQQAAEEFSAPAVVVLFTRGGRQPRLAAHGVNPGQMLEAAAGMLQAVSGLAAEDLGGEGQADKARAIAALKALYPPPPAAAAAPAKPARKTKTKEA